MRKETVAFYMTWVRHPEILKMTMFNQHKTVSTYQHSLNVTNLSILMAEKLGFTDKQIRNIIVGAMLHDYFLYDYHITKRHTENGIHAWAHPKTALSNACHVFRMNPVQKNIIRSHMWPVTLCHIPRYKEAWIVMLADKICASLELLDGHDVYRVPVKKMQCY